MRPSLEGTSACSLISCVWTDIFTTRVKGMTMPMPGVEDARRDAPEEVLHAHVTRRDDREGVPDEEHDEPHHQR